MSNHLQKRALTLMPGGVNSPVRSFKNVGLPPLYIEHAQGPYLFDTEQERYIDYIGSFGPAIVGHSHPDVLTAIHETAERGLGYGTCHPLEVTFAERLIDWMPSLERIRLTNSGTEAGMTAIRLARGFTQKNKIIKFSGCYHGHFDSMLVQAGSGAATGGYPDSAGVPKNTASDTFIAEFNNLAHVEAFFEQHAQDIAAVIVEPIAGNMGMIKPQPGFLEGLRALCTQHGALLIFDEVMTGFRVHRGGAQALFNIKPDLTMLGKIIGGGLPLAVLGGRADVMDFLAPSGPVYQAGTLSGNPLCIAAGLATLELIDNDSTYHTLHEHTKTLCQALTKSAAQYDIPIQTCQQGGIFGFFFSPSPVLNFKQAQASNHDHFKTFFKHCFNEGILFPPSPYEAQFISLAHHEPQIKATIQSIKQAFSLVHHDLTSTVS